MRAEVAKTLLWGFARFDGKKNLNPKRKRMWLFSLHSFLKTRIHWGLAAYLLQEPFILVFLRITVQLLSLHTLKSVQVLMDSHTVRARSFKHPGSHGDKVAPTPVAWHRLLKILRDRFSLRTIPSDPRLTFRTRFLHGKSFLCAQLELYCFWPALIPLADWGLRILWPGDGFENCRSPSTSPHYPKKKTIQKKNT